MIDDALKLFDSYNRSARLSPAVITLLPAVLTAALVVDLDPVSKIATSVVVGFALATLFANIARSRGKAIEEQLLNEWDGWPTTLMLRHRDRTIETPTKARYHAELQRLCPGLSLPATQADEARNMAEADDRYRSVTNRLKELRRDAKYKLLHKENANYGFRRNLLGMKPLAIWIVSLLAASAAVVIIFNLAHIHAASDVLADISTRPIPYAVFAGNLAVAIMWIVVVNKHFVRQAAEEYALALFRTLEV